MLHVALCKEKKSEELNFNPPDYEFLLRSWTVADPQATARPKFVTSQWGAKFSKIVYFSTHFLEKKNDKKQEGQIHTDT